MPVSDRVSRYVEAALAALPREYADRLENVEFVVERRVSPRTLRRFGMRHGSLYGLYEGIPLTRRGTAYTMVPPDKITIFWEPLVRDFSPDDLPAQVRKTVYHEIAHFFGIDDDALEDTSVE